MKPEHLYKLLSTEQIGSDAWYKIMDDFITEQNSKNVSIRLGEITYDNQWCRHIYYLNKTELHSTELVGIEKSSGGQNCIIHTHMYNSGDFV